MRVTSSSSLGPTCERCAATSGWSSPPGCWLGRPVLGTPTVCGAGTGTKRCGSRPGSLSIGQAIRTWMARRPRWPTSACRCTNASTRRVGCSEPSVADRGPGIGVTLSVGPWQALVVEDPQSTLIELGGGDPFDDVYRQSQAHQLAHGCGLFPAGPAVMQLASQHPGRR